MASVIHLFRAPKRREPMEELQEVRAVEEVGLQGCAHARPQGKRQLLLMDQETLAAFELMPGIVRENVTTQGLDVNGLAIGQKLQIGEVELQVSAVCDPCEQIEALRPGLQVAMQGRRGMLCKVMRGGLLKRGDEIVVMERSAAQGV
ncbi:MAG TPA: MOSC domain-containing protein [Candidatus Acidoferrales bacterium]|jgi:MOSC domain-containing protein YiiM|nr:MOSC domain-containing protein [Candidatus Acidoferrales bacterium]